VPGSRFQNVASGAFNQIFAVVRYPGFAQNQPSPAAFRVFAGGVKTGIRAVGAFGVTEGMRGIADANDRFARVGVVDNVLHLLIRQLSPAQKRNQQIRGLQLLKTGNVVFDLRIDRPIRRIDGKEHCALEALARENLRHHRHRFL
jgi:hypothetical protein